ncbi:hypothetical protein ILYODFUR_012016 [Ilyodon furcidens]|uniref:Uncharacterized protein n=1 Tax=Ilyodon furcidens TaxID=33524 RepID=A0ABV0U4Q0_9TELE
MFQYYQNVIPGSIFPLNSTPVWIFAFLPSFVLTTSVSLPQGSCGYNVAYNCQCVNVCMNGWMTDCSVKPFKFLGLDRGQAIMWPVKCGKSWSDKEGRLHGAETKRD